MAADRNSDDDTPKEKLEMHLSGLLGGMGDLGKIVANLSQLIETLDTEGDIQREHDIKDDEGRVTGKVGWRVSSLDHARRAAGQRNRQTPASSQPRNPARKPKKPPARPAQADRFVDIMTDDEHILVITQLQTLEPAQVKVHLADAQTLAITDDSAQFTVTLPRDVTKVASWQVNNGLLEVRAK